MEAISTLLVGLDLATFGFSFMTKLVRGEGVAILTAAINLTVGLGVVASIDLLQIEHVNLFWFAS